jgi:hypothetical protein
MAAPFLWGGLAAGLLSARNGTPGGSTPGCPIGDDDDLAARRDGPDDRAGRVLEVDPDDLPDDWYR